MVPNAGTDTIHPCFLWFAELWRAAAGRPYRGRRERREGFDTPGVKGAKMMDLFFTMLVPLIIGVVALYAAFRRVDVYSALVHGAGAGLDTLLRVVPALVGLMTAVYMLRASGLMELLGNLLAPALTKLGIPPETAALLFVRPVSGSGALAIGSELMASHGPDSYVGRVAAVMLGSTETTFYTIAVYFGSAGIRRTRYAIPAALLADLAGFMAAAFAVRLVFGT